MEKKSVLLILCLISAIFACEKKEDIETLFKEAEKMEADILKSLDTIDQYRNKYERILIAAPESEFAPVACYKLGKLNEVFGHYDEAIEYYRKLLSYYPEHPVCVDGLFNTAQIYRLHLKKIEDAITAYNQLIAFYPENSKTFQALLQLGQLSCQNEKWEEAIDYFQQIVAEYPDNKICDDLYFRIADILLAKLSDKPKAIKMYQDILKIYPNSSWIEYAKARLDTLTQGSAKDEK